MICGLVSGPVAYGLIFIAFDSPLPDAMKLPLGILAFIGPLLIAFSFALDTKRGFPASASTRDRVFAWFGMAAPILWGMAIFVLVVSSLGKL